MKETEDRINDLAKAMERYKIYSANEKRIMPIFSRNPVIASKRRALWLDRQAKRLRKRMYRADKALKTILRILKRQAARSRNLANRQYVKTLRAEHRKTHTRLRSRTQLSYADIPQTVYHNRDANYRFTTVGYAPATTIGIIGEVKKIYDVTPVAFLDPKPLSPVSIAGFNCGSLSTSIFVRPSTWLRPLVDLPKCKWPLYGLRGWTMSSEVPFASFLSADADKAMLKAQQKCFAPDLQLNEYIAEWHQVARLLRDPLRTMKAFHKLLKRWSDADAWIWLPSRSARRFRDGLLISKLPTGGVLMSMRTKRCIDPSEVSAAVCDQAANRWLQYRYGIAPLASDISVIMGLFRGGKPPEDLKSKSARYWVSKSSKRIPYLTSMSTPWHGTFNLDVMSGKFYSAKIFYRLRRDEPLLHKYGLSPEQWVRAIYNAVPYSFVLDWFVDLDQWMTATEFPPYISLESNSITVKEFEKVRATCVKVVEVNYGETATLSGAAIAVKQRQAMERKINYPVVTKTFVSTRWQSVKNIMTGLALIYNPLIKKR